MSMSRKDFEAIALAFKEQRTFAQRDFEERTEHMEDGDTKRTFALMYEERLKGLQSVINHLAAVFGQANPLFREDVFYHACGMHKWYDRPLAEAARLAYKDGNGADDSQYFDWLYLASPTFRFGPY